MSTVRPTFRGVYTAIITPFATDAATVDFAHLDTNIRYQAEAGVTGVVPCGTTGESPTLSDEEHRQVIEHAIEIGKPLGLEIVAGTGSNDTAYAVELRRAAHAAGADASLQVNPYYNKPSQEGLYRHFSTVADSCDLPVVLYNIPGRTGVALSPDTIVRLSTHPNIRAVKDATGGLETAGDTIARTDLAVLSGDDPLTLALGAIGGRGVVSVVSNVVPDRVVRMCHAFLDGDFASARTVHDDLLPLARALLTLDSNPVPVKTLLAALGRDTGAVRLPLCEPPHAVRETIERLVGKHDLATPMVGSSTS